MCLGHFLLWKGFVRTEKPTKLFGWTDVERFHHYVIRTPSVEIQKVFGAKPDCWVWRGALNENGYGIFKSEFSRSGNAQQVHLFALSEVAGVQLVKGEETDHHCRFRPCANPDHLERVSHRMNTLRGIGPSARNARKTHCNKGHEFSEGNTRTNEDGSRECITCTKEYFSSEEFKAARREAREPKSGVRGQGQYLAERETCSEGHELAGDNLVLEKKTVKGQEYSIRRCRKCKNARARKNHAKRVAVEVAEGVERKDCVTSPEVADLLGIKRTYLPTFRKRQVNFPEPVKVGKPSLFLREEIISWRNSHMRQEG